MTQDAAALATSIDLQKRLDRARAEGVQVEISVIDGEREDVWILDVDAVEILDDHLTVAVDGRILDFPYAGPAALPVLPSIVPVDRAHALRAQVMEIRETLEGAHGASHMMHFADARSDVLAQSDAMQINSTGIYPPLTTGMEWNEVASVHAEGGLMTVIAAHDGSTGFTMMASQ